MKKTLFISMLLVLGLNYANAQLKGNPQVGLRLGLPFGATARYFFDDANAVEAIAGAYAHTFTITGLYERHFDLSALTTEGFGWFVGGGAHMGSRKENDNVKFIAGVDAIGGIDYVFPADLNLPINVSLDWKPAVHFNTSSDLADFAISIRYTFGR
ncbi:hypothetical protein SAMN05428988_0269 [Chitinophaga sp. YR573]|jgi:hypothetical protein|uniref:hypothetical protein n=1 Tax=Chitinophaga sp. YR573 TaxID=1881040 RepID=UPI0008D4C3FB|nr:hypothetical protein [Chitinophaga sp. YR573]SEV89987.1 hypothetical protein SAMN05428988_0269 [Chitinophaga sp. YR573]